MADCTRGCTVFRKHRAPCPVSDGSDGVWMKPPLEVLDGRHVGQTQFTERYRFTPEAGTEMWYACKGCLPRPARHGTLCESCHVRLEQWLHGERHGKWWLPDMGSIAWAYDWLADDLIPGQIAVNPNKPKKRSKGEPLAALSLMIHDLRQDLAQALAQWLGMVCEQFGLYGPEWWRKRLDEAKRRQEVRSHDAYAPYAETDWRAWLPQSSSEVVDAQRYLHNWLDRVEGVSDVAVAIYDRAQELSRKVAGVAPWEPKPRRLGREVVCPECERPALAIFEGQTSVTCMRCGAVWGREKYDLWAEVIRSEKVAV